MFRCICGREFKNLHSFTAHKGNCSNYLQSIGKDVSDKRMKAEQTKIQKYGSLENFSKEHSKKIKETFINRKDTTAYYLTQINKDDFIYDYIDCNKPRIVMREKYHIPSDYMMDQIVKAFNCKKSRKQSCKLSVETEIKNHPDNIHNWQKAHETRIKNYGSLKESYKQGHEKQIQTMLDRYGVECYFNSEDIKTHINKKNTKPNIDFANLLKRNNIKFTQEFVIHNKSYDFRIGNILVEVDPTITHNSTFSPYSPYIGVDKNYHKEKSNLAKENGFQCIHVFDWDDKNKIIKLLQPRPYIAARKCIIREVMNYETTDFLNNNHLQGFCNAKVNIGLFYNDELISLMTFGKPRYNKNYEWELIRYCSTYCIKGGEQKLFQYFLRHYSPKSIISYCDESKFTGKIYEYLGFIKDSLSISKHWYNIKTSKHVLDSSLQMKGFDILFNTNYGKGTNNEVLMKEYGFVEIYACGQRKWIWNT